MASSSTSDHHSGPVGRGLGVQSPPFWTLVRAKYMAEAAGNSARGRSQHFYLFGRCAFNVPRPKKSMIRSLNLYLKSWQPTTWLCRWTNVGSIKRKWTTWGTGSRQPAYALSQKSYKPLKTLRGLNPRRRFCISLEH